MLEGMVDREWGETYLMRRISPSITEMHIQIHAHPRGPHPPRQPDVIIKIIVPVRGIHP